MASSFTKSTLLVIITFFLVCLIKGQYCTVYFPLIYHHPKIYRTDPVYVSVHNQPVLIPEWSFEPPYSDVPVIHSGILTITDTFHFLIFESFPISGNITRIKDVKQIYIQNQTLYVNGSYVCKFNDEWLIKDSKMPIYISPIDKVVCSGTHDVYFKNLTKCVLTSYEIHSKFLNFMHDWVPILAVSGCVLSFLICIAISICIKNYRCEIL